MTHIIMTCLVLCNAEPVTKIKVQSTPATFKEDVALLKRGWYNHVTGGRCKALKIRYETVKE